MPDLNLSYQWQYFLHITLVIANFCDKALIPIKSEIVKIKSNQIIIVIFNYLRCFTYFTFIVFLRKAFFQVEMWCLIFSLTTLFGSLWLIGFCSTYHIGTIKAFNTFYLEKIDPLFCCFSGNSVTCRASTKSNFSSETVFCTFSTSSAAIWWWKTEASKRLKNRNFRIWKSFRNFQKSFSQTLTSIHFTNSFLR